MSSNNVCMINGQINPILKMISILFVVTNASSTFCENTAMKRYWITSFFITNSFALFNSPTFLCDNKNAF